MHATEKYNPTRSQKEGKGDCREGKYVKATRKNKKEQERIGSSSSKELTDGEHHSQSIPSVLVSEDALVSDASSFSLANLP